MSYRPTIWATRIRLEPDEARADLIRELQATGGNVEAAARSLGVTGQTLRSWIRKLGIYQDLAWIRPPAKVRR